MFEPDIKEELERGILKAVPIEEGIIIFFADIIYQNEQPLSPPAQAFLKIVEELKDQFKGDLKVAFIPPNSVLQTH